MFSKQPSKDELRKQLQAQCDHAVLLDNSIHTLYASQPSPSKVKHRKRKPQPDAFDLELDRLKSAKAAGNTGIRLLEPESGVSEAAPVSDLADSLGREVAEFMRNRRSK